MNLHIACVTGDSFTNFYAGESEERMYERVAKEFVAKYVSESPYADDIATALEAGHWRVAVELYFNDHDSESMYVGEDSI